VRVGYPSCQSAYKRKERGVSASRGRRNWLRCPGTLYRGTEVWAVSAGFFLMNSSLTRLAIRVSALGLAALGSVAVCPPSAVAAAPVRQARAAQAAGTPAPASQGRTQEPAFPSPYDRDALSPEYRIAPGDVLQVFVWKEPDLSREVTVRTDGYMTVALVGDVLAVAKTPTGLAQELTNKLSKYINAPTVTITIVSSSTQRFFVVGEVAKPGEFPLTSRTTMLQALALAGGFREYAKTDEIRVIRQEVIVGKDRRPYTREIVLPVNYKALARGQDLHENYVLKPSDVIVVP
jgi:polysaccharide export outer membrane protein